MENMMMIVVVVVVVVVMKKITHERYDTYLIYHNHDHVT